MIYAYGITQQGSYHIKKDIVCQDAHRIIKCGDTMAVAAVADGLGSEEHSDVASRLAADLSVEYCAEHIKPDEIDDDGILATIKDSFELAQNKIEFVAAENGHELDQYDTTLSLAVLIGDRLYYGHSGDSGIIAMNTEGIYEKVTDQQRDSDGSVFPLYFGEDKWVFGRYKKPVVSVLLATDGMFEIFFPIYIRREKVSIYVALAKYFMDPKGIGFEKDGEKGVEERIGKFVSSIPEEQINDDKTIVVMANAQTEYTLQSDDYYTEPDWKVLKQKYEEEWRRQAYPYLYKTEKNEAVQKEESFSEDMSNAGKSEEDD